MNEKIDALLQERNILLMKRRNVKSSPFNGKRKNNRVKRLDTKIRKLEEKLVDELDNAGKLL